MCERVIERRHTGRIVGDRDDLSQVQPPDDRFKVAQLLLEAVGGVGGFVRGAKAQEIERYDAPSAGDQVGDQVVPDVQVVGEAVHEHKGGAGARVVASVGLSFSPRDKMLRKIYRTRGHFRSRLLSRGSVPLVSCRWFA